MSQTFSKKKLQVADSTLVNFFEIKKISFKKKQDSKELSPRPLENAPKTFHSKKLFKLFNAQRRLLINPVKHGTGHFPP